MAIECKGQDYAQSNDQVVTVFTREVLFLFEVLLLLQFWGPSQDFCTVRFFSLLALASVSCPGVLSLFARGSPSPLFVKFNELTSTLRAVGSATGEEARTTGECEQRYV